MPAARSSRAAAGAGVGHLVAGFVSPEASPVLAVGSTVIDLTPTPVKEWAVATFGTADKPILIGSVAIGALAVGGDDRARRPHSPQCRAGTARGTCADLRPGRHPAAHQHRGRPHPGVRHRARRSGYGELVLRAPRPVGRDGGDPAAGAGADDTARGDGSSGRRHVLAAAAGLGALAATAGSLGQALSRAGSPSTVTLPAAAEPLTPLPRGLEETVRGISAFRTPNKEFYRIDTALVIPRVSVEGW